MNIAVVLRQTLSAKRSLSPEEFAAWVDEMSTRLAGQSADLDEREGPVRTYGCARCQDTGYVVSRAPGKFGTEITWAHRCACSTAQASKKATTTKRERIKRGKGLERMTEVEPRNILDATNNAD